MKKAKKTIFSGIQPSGNLHLGNYLGAILQWVEMQDKYDCIFCVVDYHAITVKQDPDVLRKKIIEIAKIYIASGVSPERSVIFQQSDIKEHTELAWILNTITRMSDLFKMTQFKDKTKVDLEYIIQEIEKRIISTSATQIFSSEISNKIRELSEALNSIRKSGIGLFGYPILMAADILLYNTDVVPVGDDQVQHVELARTIARRFNQKFGDTFVIPEVIIRKEGARIMGLDNPEKKMSKSASSELNYIALTDDPAKAAKKIMRAVTDTGTEIKFDQEKKPGISNLLVIYSLLAKKSIKDLEAAYVGKGYGDFKKDLAELVKVFLIDFQEKYCKISDEEVKEILIEGAKRIEGVAKKTMEEVRKKIGVNY